MPFKINLAAAIFFVFISRNAKDQKIKIGTKQQYFKID